MLTVCFAQLTVGGLSPPKIRSLVGRSQDWLRESAATDKAAQRQWESCEELIGWLEALQRGRLQEKTLAEDELAAENLQWSGGGRETPPEQRRQRGSAHLARMSSPLGGG